MIEKPTSKDVFVRYANGEISASQAADLLGDGATVHDVIAGLHAAGLQPPRRSRATELAEIARARRILAPDTAA